MHSEKNIIINLSIDEAINIFPKNSKADMSKMLITTEGVYSVSKKIAAKKLVNIIHKIMKTTDITVTDACCNVGSDSLMLAKYFKKVNSIELDKTNFEAFKNNVEIYGYDNMNIINGDSLEILKSLEQDVIYADFPWSGKDYKKIKNLKLYLGNVELADFYKQFKYSAKLHVYKVPFNYDINNFLIQTKVKNLKISSFQLYDRVKFLFLIIKNK